MYYTIGFGGMQDDKLQEVIDNGTLFMYRADGNWDLIEYEGSVYYIAKVPGCGGGRFGGMTYSQRYRKRELRNAVEQYRKQTGTKADKYIRFKI